MSLFQFLQLLLVFHVHYPLGSAFPEPLHNSTLLTSPRAAGLVLCMCSVCKMIIIIIVAVRILQYMLKIGDHAFVHYDIQGMVGIACYID